MIHFRTVGVAYSLPYVYNHTHIAIAIFGHVARLPDNIPAHQAMLRQVELSVGRPPDPSWKRPTGRPHAKWTDQLRRDNKLLVAVTRERHCGPSRLHANDDDNTHVCVQLLRMLIIRQYLHSHATHHARCNTSCQPGHSSKRWLL